MLSKLALFTVITIGFAFSTSTADAQIREIANSRMSGIAKVKMDSQGPYVMYNPIRCAEMGGACAFFRAHEHAHIHLNHFGRGTSMIQAEREADCWAAKNVTPAVYQSAVQWFRAGNSPHVHGTGPQRAAQIGQCRQLR